MATALKRPVRRTATIDGGRIPLVITLYPEEGPRGPLLGLRVKSSRKEYRVHVGWVFYRAAEEDALRQRQEREKKRKEKRRG